MIKIIDGFRYDTEKAIAIGTATSAAPKEDLHWWHETLYKTPRAGRFFIAGAWATFSGPKEGVKPVSAAGARKWCEQYLDGGDWAQHFPSGAIQDA